VAIGLLLATASVAQSAFIPAIGLRLHTAAPVFLIVLALSRRLEFGPALAVGVSAGLLVDIAPPAAGPVGINALVGALAAATMYAWTRVTATDSATLSATLILLVAAVALVALLRAIITDVFAAGTPTVVVLRAMARDAVISALLAPLLLPLVDWLVRPRSQSWAMSAGMRARR
jgi:hypothetical protein